MGTLLVVALVVAAVAGGVVGSRRRDGERNNVREAVAMLVGGLLMVVAPWLPWFGRLGLMTAAAHGGLAYLPMLPGAVSVVSGFVTAARRRLQFGALMPLGFVVLGDFALAPLFSKQDGTGLGEWLFIIGSALAVGGAMVALADGRPGDPEPGSPES